VAAARAAVTQAAWRLEQKSVAAPVAGLVQDTFFVEGEWVPAGRPVVSLLPPGNVKARFYVPETVLGSIQPGRAVEIRCDGCSAPLAAKVSFVSTQAEYTPPVLYSKESRTKLLYLVEARPAPADGARLRPGQPVDVRLK
jgi:HlyD family secretion protein